MGSVSPQTLFWTCGGAWPATSSAGQQEIVERLLIGLLANGNLLVEGRPGSQWIQQTSLPCWLPHRQRCQGRYVIKVLVRGQQCQVMM